MYSPLPNKLARSRKELPGGPGPLSWVGCQTEGIVPRGAPHKKLTYALLVLSLFSEKSTRAVMGSLWISSNSLHNKLNQYNLYMQFCLGAAHTMTPPRIKGWLA